MPNSASFRLHVSGDGLASNDVDARAGLTIGRSSTSDLRLDHPAVSSRHGRLDDKGDELCYVNLSTYGTQVDGARVLQPEESIALRDGLSLRLGGASVTVRAVPPKHQSAVHSALAPRGKEPVGPSPLAQGHAQPIPAVRVEDAELDAIAQPSGDLTMLPGGDPKATGGAAAKHLVERLEARLVLAAEGDRRVVPVRVSPFQVGREDDAHCRLEHAAVSRRHAQITFDSAHNAFLVEDLGSGLGTHVGNTTLAPRFKVELRSDTYVRFGTIDAVFVQALDRDFTPVAAQLHERALRLLVARRRVPRAEAADARRRAQRDARPLVEVLVTQGVVGAREWCEAVAEARERGETWVDRLRRRVDTLAARRRARGSALLVALLTAAETLP